MGVSTVREIAEAANVKPNTFVRMARQVGFEGYDDFREPFREAIRQGQMTLSRPRPLPAGQSRKSGHLGELYADMIQVAAAIRNIEETPLQVSRADALTAAAKAIWTCAQRLSSLASA